MGRSGRQSAKQLAEKLRKAEEEKARAPWEKGERRRRWVIREDKQQEMKKRKNLKINFGDIKTLFSF